MDKLTAMKSFVEVARTCSFTKAADNLSLSRLQVSRHVQEIEDWLKQRLLHRTTRKVSLTNAGEEALLRCEQILHQTAEMEMKAMEHSASLSGTIRISAPTGIAQNMLIDAISDYSISHPQVVIDIIGSDHNSQLVDERVDIALRFTRQPDDTLIARKLMNIDTQLCASPAYLDSHLPVTKPEDLRSHNCLVHLTQRKWTFIHHSEHQIIEVNGTIRSDNMEVLTRAALVHQGLVLLPCDMANPLLRSGQLKPLLSHYQTPGSTLWAVYLSRSYQTMLVRHFIDFLADRWQKDIQSEGRIRQAE